MYYSVFFKVILCVAFFSFKEVICIGVELLDFIGERPRDSTYNKLQMVTRDFIDSFHPVLHDTTFAISERTSISDIAFDVYGNCIIVGKVENVNLHYNNDWERSFGYYSNPLSQIFIVPATIPEAIITGKKSNANRFTAFGEVIEKLTGSVRGVDSNCHHENSIGNRKLVKSGNGHQILTYYPPLCSFMISGDFRMKLKDGRVRTKLALYDSTDQYWYEVRPTVSEGENAFHIDSVDDFVFLIDRIYVALDGGRLGYFTYEKGEINYLQPAYSVSSYEYGEFQEILNYATENENAKVSTMRAVYHWLDVHLFISGEFSSGECQNFCHFLNDEIVPIDEREVDYLEKIIGMEVEVIDECEDGSICDERENGGITVTFASKKNVYFYTYDYVLKTSRLDVLLEGEGKFEENVKINRVGKAEGGHPMLFLNTWSKFSFLPSGGCCNKGVSTFQYNLDYDCKTDLHDCKMDHLHCNVVANGCPENNWEGGSMEYRKFNYHADMYPFLIDTEPSVGDFNDFDDFYINTKNSGGHSREFFHVLLINGEHWEFPDEVIEQKMIQKFEQRWDGETQVHHLEEITEETMTLRLYANFTELKQKHGSIDTVSLYSRNLLGKGYVGQSILLLDSYPENFEHAVVKQDVSLKGGSATVVLCIIAFVLWLCTTCIFLIPCRIDGMKQFFRSRTHNVYYRAFPEDRFADAVKEKIKKDEKLRSTARFHENDENKMLSMYITISLVLFYVFCVAYSTESILSRFRLDLYNTEEKQREVLESERNVEVFFQNYHTIANESRSEYSQFHAFVGVLPSDIDFIEIPRVDFSNDPFCRVKNNCRERTRVFFPIYHESLKSEADTYERIALRQQNNYFDIHWDAFSRIGSRISLEFRWIEIMQVNQGLTWDLLDIIGGVFPFVFQLYENNPTKRTLELTKAFVHEKESESETRRIVISLDENVTTRKFIPPPYANIFISAISLLGSALALRVPLTKVLHRSYQVISKKVDNVIEIVIVLFLWLMQWLILTINLNVQRTVLQEKWIFPHSSNSFLLWFILLSYLWNANFLSAFKSIKFTRKHCCLMLTEPFIKLGRIWKRSCLFKFYFLPGFIILTIFVVIESIFYIIIWVLMLIWMTNKRLSKLMKLDNNEGDGGGPALIMTFEFLLFDNIAIILLIIMFVIWKLKKMNKLMKEIEDKDTKIKPTTEEMTEVENLKEEDSSEDTYVTHDSKMKLVEDEEEKLSEGKNLQKQTQIMGGINYEEDKKDRATEPILSQNDINNVDVDDQNQNKPLVVPDFSAVHQFTGDLS